MIYNPKRTYTQVEVDRIVEQAIEERALEAETLEAFSKLSLDPPVNGQTEETAILTQVIDTGFDRRNHVRFPLDWQEKAIPSKLLYPDETGFFNYYAQNNKVAGFIVLWQHGYFQSQAEAHAWIRRVVYAKDGKLHSVGIQDAVVVNSYFDDSNADVYFYFTDFNKAWDFYKFQDIDNKAVNWKDYE